MVDDAASCCLHRSEEGVYLDISVSPNSSRDHIERVDQWRNRLKVFVKSKTQNGKANQSIIELIAEEFGIKSSTVSIVKGRRSDKKRLFIDMDKGQAVLLLQKILGVKYEDQGEIGRD